MKETHLLSPAQFYMNRYIKICYNVLKNIDDSNF